MQKFSIKQILLTNKSKRMMCNLSCIYTLLHEQIKVLGFLK